MKTTDPRPHILDSESDPRILRDLAKMMDSEIKRLNAVIQNIQAEKDKQAQGKNYSWWELADSSEKIFWSKLGEWH